MNRVYWIALLIEDPFRYSLQLQHLHALTKEALESIDALLNINALPVSRPLKLLHRHATSRALSLCRLVWFDNHPDHSHYL